jgi:hypothetical protein
MTQAIKLYPPGVPPNVVPTDTQTPVVAETYDEVVFTNPSETFFQELQSLAQAPTIKYSQEAHFLQYSDSDDNKVLLEARKFLQNELLLAKERLLQVDGDLARADEALREEQEQRKKTTPANASGIQQRSKIAAASRTSSTAPASKKTKTT